MAGERQWRNRSRGVGVSGWESLWASPRLRPRVGGGPLCYFTRERGLSPGGPISTTAPVSSLKSFSVAREELMTKER